MKRKVPKVEDNIVKKIKAITKKKTTSPDTPSPKVLKDKTVDTKSIINKKHNVSKIHRIIKDHNKTVDLKEQTFLLKDVLDLGGTEDDFQMLQNIDNDANDKEVETEVDNAGSSSFNVGELVSYMKANGLKPSKKPKKEKPAEDAFENKPPEVKVAEPEPCSFVPSDPPPHDLLLFTPNEPWFLQVESYKSSKIFSGTDKWKRYAEQVWDHENVLSNKLRDKHSSSDQQWMKTVFAGGTINDKVSAHCLLLQESPVHHIKSLEALLGMAKKKSKRLSIQAIDTLKDMFLSTIIPDDRKLLSFHQHDFSVLSSKKCQTSVLGWLVEDRLKSCYTEYIETIKLHLSDNEVPIRTKLCNLVFQLLTEKPEKEQELLAILVNKIGDPDNKLASKIIYILGQLLKNHPSMKTVVASEVEQVLFRPNISEKAQYYSICFLNQLQLYPEDSDFAAHLIQIYFKFFKESVDHKNLDSRMLGGLLTGVNRSYPYTSDQNGITDDNINTLFQLVYVSNFNVSVQALMLLYQVSGNKADISNRYYQALYSKLFDPTISSSSKKTFLLNLIYKSLKRDDKTGRKVAIARRLLQVSNLDDPVLACAALYTISEANKNSTKSPTEVEEVNENKTSEYDKSARNPLYSNADKVGLWEFSLLTRNYHPSVNQFVTSLLDEGDIQYNGDPFNDFTRSNFLDKFVFKNPKNNIKAANKKFYSRNKLEKQQPQVYSSDFKDQAQSKINPDELFFYQYFKTKTPVKQPQEGGELDFADDIKDVVVTQTEKKKKKKKPSDNEDEDVGSDLDDSDADSDFSYGDIGDEEAEGDTEQLNDKAYEKFLWEHLDSDGESIQGSEGEEGEWEDIEVGESEGEDKSDFVDAEQLDSVIMKRSGKKRKKKNKDKSQSDPVVSKKKSKKGKKSNKTPK